MRDHPSWVERATYYTDKDGYERWEQAGGPDKEFNRRTVLVHRLLMVAERGFDALRGMFVHHRNGIKWDNRPGNLELMTPSEHATHHGERREYENKISDEELLADLRAGAAILGRTPGPSEVDDFGEYSSDVYYQRFGGWLEAVEEAGLDVEDIEERFDRGAPA